MALAMSVGATRIQILHETALAAVDADGTALSNKDGEADQEDTACST